MFSKRIINYQIKTFKNLNIMKKRRTAIANKNGKSNGLIMETYSPITKSWQKSSPMNIPYNIYYKMYFKARFIETVEKEWQMTHFCNKDQSYRIMHVDIQHSIYGDALAVFFCNRKTKLKEFYITPDKIFSNQYFTNEISKEDFESKIDVFSKNHF
jgi:hypothetical protein